MSSQTQKLIIELQAKIDKYNRDILRAAKATKKFQTDTSTSFNKIQSKAKQTGNSLFKFSNVATGVFAALSVHAFTAFADEIQLADNQLKNVTSSAEQFALVQLELNKIAKDTRQSVSGLTSVYARFSRAGQEAGFTQREILDLTESLTKAFKIEGNTTAEVNSTLLQLTQSFRSGRIAGEEFRSVSESSTLVLQAMAKQLGVNVGELKKLAAEGILTPRVLIDGLKKTTKEIDSQFRDLEPTFSDLGDLLGNAFAKGYKASGAESIVGDLKRGIELAIKLSSGGFDLSAGGVGTKGQKDLGGDAAKERDLAAIAEAKAFENKMVAERAFFAEKKAFESTLAAVKRDNSLSEEDRLNVLAALRNEAFNRQLISIEELNASHIESSSIVTEIEKEEQAVRFQQEKDFIDTVQAIKNDATLTDIQRFSLVTAARGAALEQQLIDIKSFNAAQEEAANELLEKQASTANVDDPRIESELMFIEQLADINLMKMETLEEQLNKELELQKALLDNKLINEEDFLKAQQAAAVKFGKGKDADVNRDKKRDSERVISQQKYLAAASILANTFFEDNKAINAGLVVADTASAIMGSLKINPYDYANVAVIAATGIAQLAQIFSSSKGGGSISGASGGGGGGSSQQSTPEFAPETSGLDVTEITDTGTRELVVTLKTEDGRSLATMIGEELDEIKRNGG